MRHAPPSHDMTMGSVSLRNCGTKKYDINLIVKGTLGLKNKEIDECAFFWDYYILGWGEPMAKIFGLWVN